MNYFLSVLKDASIQLMKSADQSTIERDRLRSIVEASEWTGLKEVTWRKKIARREVTHVKLGRRTLVPESEILRIIAEVPFRPWALRDQGGRDDCANRCHTGSREAPSRGIPVSARIARYGSVLAIPYRDENGEVLFERIRLSPDGERRFLQPAGVPLVPYGLDRLKMHATVKSRSWSRASPTPGLCGT